MNYFRVLNKFKFLLVDDDEFIRDSLRIVFKNNGCSMWTVETAEEGLQALKQERFDVIISDLRLPGIDGLEFLRMAKTCQEGALRMLITAYRDKAIISEATPFGINNYIEKPFSVEYLAKSLAMLIRTHL